MFVSEVDIYDPWANTKEVEFEYGINIEKTLNQQKKYDCITLAVPHNEFKNLNISKLKNQNSFVYDIKGFLGINPIKDFNKKNDMFEKIIGRNKNLFIDDIINHENSICNIISESRFLILGAAGTIGQAVTNEIFKRNPKKLHVVDISENNLVELVRDLRSSYGYNSGIFQSFCLDIGSRQYDLFIDQDGRYDYVLNLSALKHVRSESNPYTLMRMIEVNILNTEKTIIQSINKGVKKYFCVSTDKATNPVNMMGATKLVMEKFLEKYSHKINISTARFANVAFSDGSLLHGFKQRIEKFQPIVAPNDVKRYFISKEESGQLCLMSCLFGDNCDIFFQN